MLLHHIKKSCEKSEVRVALACALVVLSLAAPLPLAASSAASRWVVLLAMLPTVVAAFALCLWWRARDPLERLRLMMDATSAAILTVDAQGRIESANFGAIKLFGYDEDEM